MIERKDTFLMLTSKLEISGKVKRNFRKIEYHPDYLNRKDCFVAALN
ncbi:hypothetical protein AC79_5395 [Escherichia coli 8-415-05_S4_C1]|nr:hypothetical protein AC79_5395 [Escherichia coli 8-415-05_S4_C1]KEN30297.1 hypothetical protein AC54_4870 [Escherichia coli 8-415-05_S3_C3]KEN32728.1 hypothetical protein AB96_5381 [Escherichia coli 8-415-05_S3_C1]